MAKNILALLGLVVVILSPLINAQIHPAVPNSLHHQRTTNYLNDPLFKRALSSVLTRRNLTSSKSFELITRLVRNSRPVRDLLSANRPKLWTPSGPENAASLRHSFNRGVANITGDFLKPFIHFNNRVSKTASTLPDLFAANGALIGSAIATPIRLSAHVFNHLARMLNPNLVHHHYQHQNNDSSFDFESRFSNELNTTSMNDTTANLTYFTESARKLAKQIQHLGAEMKKAGKSISHVGLNLLELSKARTSLGPVNNNNGTKDLEGLLDEVSQFVNATKVVVAVPEVSQDAPKENPEEIATSRNAELTTEETEPMVTSVPRESYPEPDLETASSDPEALTTSALQTERAMIVNNEVEVVTTPTTSPSSAPILVTTMELLVPAVTVMSRSAESQEAPEAVTEQLLPSFSPSDATPASFRSEDIEIFDSDVIFETVAPSVDVVTEIQPIVDQQTIQPEVVLELTTTAAVQKNLTAASLNVTSEVVTVVPEIVSEAEAKVEQQQKEILKSGIDLQQALDAPSTSLPQSFTEQLATMVTRDGQTVEMVTGQI